MIGQLRDGDAGEGGGDQPHHQAERADDELRGGPPVGRPVDRPHAVAEETAQEPAEQEPDQHPGDDDRRPRAVPPRGREPVVQGQGGGGLVGAEPADDGQDDPAHDDQHGGSAPRGR